MKDQTLMSRLSSRATGRSRRQADNWRQREATLATSLPRWRTEARTHLLIRVFLGCLAFGVVTAIVQIFWFPFLFAWLPFTLATCISWTMLRIVVNTRDVAPAEELDEYENEVVRTWQVAAYGMFSTFTLAVAFYMVFLPVINPDGLDHWIYSGGLFTILGLMAIIAMPTIAYATTFGPVPAPGTTPPEGADVEQDDTNSGPDPGTTADTDTSTDTTTPTRGAPHAHPGA